MDKAMKRRAYFEKYARRSDCAACDRAEAAAQIRRIEAEMSAISNSLKSFDQNGECG